MVMPIVMSLDDVELGHMYMVAACDGEVGVSFQARLEDIEKPAHNEQWVLHFEGYITLRVIDNRKIVLFEVLEL